MTTHIVDSLRRMRLSYVVAALVAAGAVLLTFVVPKVEAAITVLDVSPADSTAGATNAVTITFTNTVNAIPAGGDILVNLAGTGAPGFVLSGASLTSITVGGGGDLGPSGTGDIALAAGGDNSEVILTSTAGQAVGAWVITLGGVVNATGVGDPGSHTITTRNAVDATLDTLSANAAGDAITHAAASALSVAIEPSASTVAGVAIATQPIVEVHDAFGNVVTTGGDSTQTITAALTTGTGRCPAPRSKLRSQASRTSWATACRSTS